MSSSYPTVVSSNLNPDHHFVIRQGRIQEFQTFNYRCGRGANLLPRNIPHKAQLLARKNFTIDREIGTVERMIRSQVSAAIFTVGLP